MTTRHKSYDAATDIRLANYIRQLRQHLSTCASCKGAIKADDHTKLCYSSRRLILMVAKLSAILWEVKKAAYANPGGTVYACPDIRKHGETAEDTACPLIVHDYAERLF